MDQPPSSLDYFPLLQQPDIWDSLDTPTQEKVLDTSRAVGLVCLRVPVQSRHVVGHKTIATQSGDSAP